MKEQYEVLITEDNEAAALNLERERARLRGFK